MSSEEVMKFQATEEEIANPETMTVAEMVKFVGGEDF